MEKHCKRGKAGHVLALCLSLLAGSAVAGSKPLTVAFFDFTGGVGKASFKALRTSGIEHPCWQGFVEITGIETAYIENPPKGLDPQELRRAVLGDAAAAERFRLALSNAKLDGAYAFMSDPSGRFGVVHGIGYQTISVTSSASMALPEGKKQLLDAKVLSKHLCEASKAMD